MRKQQIIVSIPDATDFATLPGQLLETFKLLGVISVPTWTMPGTRAVANRRLIHMMSTATSGTIQWLLDMFNSTAPQGWSVDAAPAKMKMHKWKPGKIPPWAQDTWNVEAAQEWTLEHDPDTGAVTGGVYKPVPLSLLDYVDDQYDEDGNVLPRSTAAIPLHTFSGAEQWKWAKARAISGAEFRI